MVVLRPGTVAHRRSVAVDSGVSKSDHCEEAKECLARALALRPASLPARYQAGAVALQENRLEDARVELEAVVKEAPKYTEAHVTLATVYYRLKRREDGDRERAIVQKLNAEAQLKQQQGVNVK